MTAVPVVPVLDAEAGQGARRRKRTAYAGALHSLRNLELAEISCVDLGANEGAKALLFKNLARVDTGEGAPLAASPPPILPADIDKMVAHAMAKVTARMEAAAIGKALPPSRPATAHERESEQLTSLAALAREGQPSAPRAYWHSVLTQLGEHLLPDASPLERQRAAMADPRGRSFVTALMACER
jgi:hypothetical protein